MTKRCHRPRPFMLACLLLMIGIASNVHADTTCVDASPLAPGGGFAVDLQALGIPIDATSVAARLLVGEDWILTETYELAPNHGGFVSLWLGDARRTLSQEDRQRQHENGVRVALTTGPRDVVEVTFDDLLVMDARLRASGIQPVTPTGFTLVEAGKNAMGADALAPRAGSEIVNKSTFTCPNTQPFCDDEEEYCIDGCDYGDPSCLAQCEDEFEWCLTGEPVGTRTERVVTSYSFETQICGYYPWYKAFDSHDWDRYSAIFRTRTYQRLYCPSVGNTFEVLTSTTFNQDLCYVETNDSCVLGTYMGGRCRWSQPGG